MADFVLIGFAKRFGYKPVRDHEGRIQFFKRRSKNGATVSRALMAEAQRDPEFAERLGLKR